MPMRLKPAMFLLAPAATLMSQGALNGFNSQGTTWATVAGGLGAIGALFIILAFKSGGLPTYVMPLVFGGAPVINVLVTKSVGSSFWARA